ncbi:hypothetical protein FOB64_002735 [Candida albicans]|uniref:AAA protein C-terminal winged helix domain-containing protein n=1 Tax=Candida albicans TaxID=5476 RepID=A0A8H6C2E8_CANAX|nr:hypothetical protein FOB64_002735 [Candida albicans]
MWLVGDDMDDDVMESGKFSSSAMLLMREFVEMDRQKSNPLLISLLPELPLWRARQIMTRPDYIQRFDNLNILPLISNRETRELVLKDLQLGSHYEMLKKKHPEGENFKFSMIKSPKQNDLHGDFDKYNTEEINQADDDDEDEDDLYLEEINRKDSRKWWKKRMQKYDRLFLPDDNKHSEEGDLDINRPREMSRLTLCLSKYTYSVAYY